MRYMGDSIIQIIEDLDNIESGYHTLEVKDEIYDSEIVIIDHTVHLYNNPTWGDSIDDQTMLIVIIKGDLFVNGDVIVSPQARKKGFFLYVTKTIFNNGEISMRARGAKGEGQNVYLYNWITTMDYVPKDGAIGAIGSMQASSGTSSNTTYAPNGDNGSNRGTGGGGSGAGRGSVGGSGTQGTSYSGGSGGGGGYNGAAGESGYINGGKGGNGRANALWTYGSGGGAGNPGGSGISNGSPGETGTGGLLIVVAFRILNAGTITASGSNGGAGYRSGGGGSGGGTVNIFSSMDVTNGGMIVANGGARGSGTRGGEDSHGGAGGNGTTNITIIPMTADIDIYNLIKNTNNIYCYNRIIHKFYSLILDINNKYCERNIPKNQVCLQNFCLVRSRRINQFQIIANWLTKPFIIIKRIFPKLKLISSIQKLLSHRNYQQFYKAKLNITNLLTLIRRTIYTRSVIFQQPYLRQKVTYNKGKIVLLNYLFNRSIHLLSKISIHDKIMIRVLQMKKGKFIPSIQIFGLKLLYALVIAYKGVQSLLQQWRKKSAPRMAPLEIEWNREPSIDNPWGGRVLNGIIVSDKVSQPLDAATPRAQPLSFVWTKEN